MPRAGSPAPARPRSASPAKGSKKKPAEKKSSKKKKKKEADESSEADDDIRLAGLGDTDGKQSSCFASQLARHLEPLTINLSHCADSYDLFAAAWRLLDKQAEIDLAAARAGGEGADEAGRRYERWANAREEKLKEKAQAALKELTEEFS